MRDAPGNLLLALDTSSETIGFAVSDGAQLLVEATWRGQRRGTATLLAEVVRALEQLGGAPDDLGAVAVATGPGSFSGLRVGMGIAKGLALGLAIPIVGCPTLAATAAPFTFAALPVCALVVAGRGRYAYAIFARAEGAAIHEMAPAQHGTAAAIGAALASYPAIVVCGELDGAEATLRECVPGAIIPAVGVRTRRPGALADMAWRRILRGDSDDLVTLEPMYLHTSPGSDAARSKG